MTIIEIAALPNGAHKNQTWHDEVIPEGWALIPEDMTIPASFPFVDLVVEERNYYREIEQETVIIREVVEMVEKEKPEPKPGIFDQPSTGTGLTDEAMAAAIMEGVESV